MATQTEKINVIVDDKGTAKIVRKEVAGIGRAADVSKSSVGLLGKALASVGATVALGAAVNTLRNFSQEMSTVKAITGATQGEFEQLRAVAKDLGATTRFSATQAAEGMSFLARAGFTTQQVMASVDDTLLLAQAGALELGSAADIASNVLTGFAISADDAGRVVDVLAMAANSSNTNVLQLGDALKYVAPIAAGLGVSLEETTAAVGALSDAGLQASLAGTGLKRVFAELESPAAKTKKILASMGVSADQVKISQVGLTSALETLKKAGIDTGQALEVFGDRGGPAFKVLVENIPKLEKLNQKFLESGGYAKEVARVMDDNLNGALLAVRSALEAVVLAFGDLGAESYLTEFARGFAASLRWVADNAKGAAEAVGFLIVAMNASKVIAFTKAVGGAGAAVKRLTAAIAANPLGLLLTAITAVVAGLLLFQDEITITSDGITTLGDLLTATWEAAAEAVWVLGQAFKEVFGLINLEGLKAFEGIEISIESVLGGTAWVVDKMLGFWTGLWRAIVALWETFPEALVNIFKQAMNATIAVIEDNINDTIDLINLFKRAVGLDEIARIQIDRFGDITKAGMADVGQAMGDAFVSGFDLSYAQDAVISLLDRSTQLANERKKLEEAQSKGGAGAPTGKGGAAADITANAPLVPESEDFQKYLESLAQEKELLMLTGAEREIQTEILALEKDLKRELTAAEEELVSVKLEELLQLERQSKLLEEIQGPQAEYNLNVEALNALLKDGSISLEEYNDKIKEMDLKEKADEMKEFKDIASDAFGTASDALSEFVETGKVNFEGLVVSILEGLKEIAFQMAEQAFMESLSGATGGGGGGGMFGGAGGGAMGAGGAVGSLLGSWIRGYADGGRPPTNKPIVVGERGPEVFVPDTSGVIVPNNEITVEGHRVENNMYNMINPGEIVTQSLKTPAGKKAFINEIKENPTEIKQILGR